MNANEYENWNHYDYAFEDEYENEDDDYDCEFADPGGRSALRAGERCHPCPTCKEPDMLTDRDVRLGYQCDVCADRAERGGY